MGLLLRVNNYYKKCDISLSILVTFVIFAVVQNWSTLLFVIYLSALGK